MKGGEGRGGRERKEERSWELVSERMILAVNQNAAGNCVQARENEERDRHMHREIARD